MKDCRNLREGIHQIFGKGTRTFSAQRSLRRAIFRTVNWFEIVLAVLLYFAFSASNFGPLILNALLDHLSGKKSWRNMFLLS